MKKFNNLEGGYIQIPNELLNDKNLSWKAKGLFCFMASKPDNFNFTVQSLATQYNTGRATIFSAMDELKSSGWMNYTKKADGKGKYQLNTTLKPKSEKQTMEQTALYQPKSEMRTEAIEPKSDNREEGFRTVGKPDCINKTDLVNKTDLYKKGQKNIQKTDDHKQAIHLPHQQKVTIDGLLTAIQQGEYK